jgi:hypothetical protein
MSIALVLGALESGLPYREQIVLVQLASYARKDGTECRPGIIRLAKRCGMHRTVVMKATARLEELGWLVRVHMGKRVHYLLDAPRLVALSDRTSRHKRPDQSLRATGSGHETVREDSPERAGARASRSRPDAQPAAFKPAPADEIWQRLVPFVRERLEQDARRMIEGGATDTQVIQRLHGQVSREQIRAWRDELLAAGGRCS